MKITASEYQINNSDVAPDNTSVNLGTKNALFGVGHNLSALATHNIIAGEGHIVTDTEDASHQAIFGYANEVKDNYGGLVAGFENKITSTGGTLGNYIFGANNTVSTGGGWNFIFGRGAEVSSESNILLMQGGNSQIGQDYSIVIGSGDTVKTTAETGSVIIGYGISRGDHCYILGFQSYAELNGKYGTAIGHMALTDNYGQFAQSAGMFAQVGDAQTSIMVLRKVTTNDTETELTLDGATNYIKTLDNHAYCISIFMIAKVAGSTEGVAFGDAQGVYGVVRGTGEASIVLMSGPGATNPDAYTSLAGLNSTQYRVDVDTTDGHIKVLVTGIAATTINWVARVTMTEVRVL